MKARKYLCILLAGVISAAFCGCQIFTTDTARLLAAPQLTGELKPIEAALREGIKGDYTLRYPSGGERRSAVILQDIDGNGVQEAFAFYSSGDGKMHLAMICRKDEKWITGDDTSLTAGGVERIDFCDFNGDGVDEVLVGWEIHGSADKQLAVYEVASGKFEQLILKRYTAYTDCDLDSDGQNELFLQLLSSSDAANRAYLYSLGAEGFTEIASCAMDRGVKSVLTQTPLPLSSGQPAIYIEELKNAGAVTEVLFLSKGQLVNPLLDETGGENFVTERASSLLCLDIDQDGLIEIPVAEEIPAIAGSAEKCYYTKWRSFNGETLLTKRTELINQSDGFYMIIPEKWIGHIAVYCDTEKRLREFYALDEYGQPAEILVRLRSVDTDEWDSEGYVRGELTELLRNDETVLAGEANPGEGSLALTTEALKQQLYILERGEKH